MVAWWGPVLGPLWGGYSPPLWPASCYPRDGASAPEAFAPPHGRLALLKRGPATPLRVRNALRAPPVLKLTSRCALTISCTKRKGARLKRYVNNPEDGIWRARLECPFA